MCGCVFEFFKLGSFVLCFFSYFFGVVLGFRVFGEMPASAKRTIQPMAACKTKSKSFARVSLESSLAACTARWYNFSCSMVQAFWV